MKSLLSGNGNIHFDGRHSPFKTALFLLVCLAWVLPGLTGHTPWKYDEAVSQGIVHGMLHGGNWLSPTLAGETFFSHPPFYYWSAALFARLLGGYLPAHDAARLVSGLFMIITFIGLWIGSNSLFGQRAPRAAILVFIGSMGLILRAHEMSGALSWMAGLSLTLAAIPLSSRRPAIAGALAGFGLSMAFLSIGLLALGVLLPILVLSPLLAEQTRPKSFLFYIGFFLLLSLPTFVWWPWSLNHHYPTLYKEWWNILAEPVLHPSQWIASDRNPFYYFAVASWFAWPAAPLSLWILWRNGWRGLKTAQTRWLLMVLAVEFIALGFGTHPHEANSLMLLIPFSLLAAGNIDSLDRSAASAMDWFGVITFGLITVLLWAGWIALAVGSPAQLVHWLDAQVPGFQLHWSWATVGLASFLTLVWIITMTNTHPSPRRALVNWSVGMTVCWMLIMTLWLPYVEASRSYQQVMASLGSALPSNRGCVASFGLGEPQRALLDYYLNLRTQRVELHRGEGCSLYLVQGKPQDPPRPPQGWHVIWTGARKGDRNERFWLLSR